MAITTRAKVKLSLGIPAGSTQHDALIDDILLGVDDDINGFLGIAALTVNTYNHAFDIENRTNELRLREWPIVSVAAVTESEALVDATDYYVDNDNGYIRFIDQTRTFNIGRQTIEVSYTAGRNPIPPQIVRAATIIACAHFNAVRHEGLNQESMGTYQYKRSQDDDAMMPRRALQILQKYMEVVVD